MRPIVIIAVAGLTLAACQKADAPAADANEAVAAETDAAANAAMTPASGSTYEYTMDGEARTLSVDPAGAYVIDAAGKHLDHGTTEMRDGKMCFTSAMPENKDQDGCWTDAKLEVGQSGETTSDKGQKLTIKRVEYKAAAM